MYDTIPNRVPYSQLPIYYLDYSASLPSRSCAIVLPRPDWQGYVAGHVPEPKMYSEIISPLPPTAQLWMLGKTSNLKGADLCKRDRIEELRKELEGMAKAT
jgi:hypothetical protein